MAQHTAQHRFCGTNVADEPSIKKVRPLAETLKYRNPAVLKKFQEAYAVSLRDAEVLFTEVKRWLWLNARANLLPGAPKLYVYPEMTAIDEMWHTFLLFTKDYEAFCTRFLGHFVHHVPNTDGRMEHEARQERKDPQLRRQLYEDAIRFICGELGEDTALRWFKTFPKRFSLSVLDRRRRSLGAIIAAMA